MSHWAYEYELNAEPLAHLQLYLSEQSYFIKSYQVVGDVGGMVRQLHCLSESGQQGLESSICCGLQSSVLWSGEIYGIYHHHYYWSASIQLYQVFSSKDNWRWSRLQPVFSNIQSSSFIFIKPVRDGPAGLFSHLAMVNLDNDHEFNNHFITTLTLGTFSVSRILGWDTVRNIM